MTSHRIWIVLVLAGCTSAAEELESSDATTVAIAGPFRTSYTSCNGKTTTSCATLPVPYDYDKYGPCCRTKEVLFFGPTTPGEYPLFQWTSGTNTSPTDMYGVAVAQEMAARGMIAFIPDYMNQWNFGLPATVQTANEGVTCEPMLAKARTMSDPTLATSALSQLLAAVPVALPGVSAAMDKGIVTAGHSQGAAMAGLVAEYNPAIRASWGLSIGDRLLPGGVFGRGSFTTALVDDSACGFYTKTKLEQVRIVNGEHDPLIGGVNASNQPTFDRWNAQDVTGVGFAGDARSTASTLSTPSGTGYSVVAEDQVCGGAGHAYFLCGTHCWCQSFYDVSSADPNRCSTAAPAECKRLTCDTTHSSDGAIVCVAGQAKSACPNHPEASCPTSGNVAINTDTTGAHSVDVVLMALDPYWWSTTASWGLGYNTSWLYGAVTP